MTFRSPIDSVPCRLAPILPPPEALCLFICTYIFITNRRAHYAVEISILILFLLLRLVVVVAVVVVVVVVVAVAAAAAAATRPLLLLFLLLRLNTRRAPSCVQREGSLTGGCCYFYRQQSGTTQDVPEKGVALGVDMHCGHKCPNQKKRTRQAFSLNHGFQACEGH